MNLHLALASIKSVLSLSCNLQGCAICTVPLAHPSYAPALYEKVAHFSLILCLELTPLQSRIGRVVPFRLPLPEQITWPPPEQQHKMCKAFGDLRCLLDSKKYVWEQLIPIVATFVYHSS